MASLGQKQVGEMMAGDDTIKKLLNMSDSELMTAMGLTAQMVAMRETLERADKLQGENREKVINRLDERMAPKISTYDIDYMIDDMTKKGSKKNPGPECC